jgi:nicotinamide-nucleotide amidase
MSIAAQIIEIARSLGLRITTAESCTGGMVSAALTDIAGSSAVFERGFVTYSNTAKAEMLNVSPATLQSFGAVSEAVACEMARGALEAARAQIAVSISGIAGPGGSDHKPEGRVCFAIATKSFDATIDLRSETVEFGARGRAAVRAAACDHALMMILNAALIKA